MSKGKSRTQQKKKPRQRPQKRATDKKSWGEAIDDL